MVIALLKKSELRRDEMMYKNELGEIALILGWI